MECSYFVCVFVYCFYYECGLVGHFISFMISFSMLYNAYVKYFLTSMTMRFICSKHQLYKVTPAVYIMIDLRKIQLSALSQRTAIHPYILQPIPTGFPQMEQNYPLTPFKKAILSLKLVSHEIITLLIIPLFTALTHYTL